MVRMEQFVPIVTIFAKNQNIICLDGQSIEISGTHTGYTAITTIHVLGISRIDTITTHVLGNFITPSAITTHGKVCTVVRDFHVCYISQIVVEVDIGSTIFLAKFFDAIVSDGDMLYIFHTIGCTRQDALEVNLSFGTFDFTTLQCCAHTLCHKGRIVHATSTQVVCTHHEEDFLGTTCEGCLKMFEHDRCFGTIHTAVYDICIAKGFPPLVHIGDAIA